MLSPKIRLLGQALRSFSRTEPSPRLRWNSGLCAITVAVRSEAGEEQVVQVDEGGSTRIGCYENYGGATVFAVSSSPPPLYYSARFQVGRGIFATLVRSTPTYGRQEKALG